MSTVSPSQSRHTQSRKTTSRRTVEASFLGGIEFSSGSYSRQPKEEPSLAYQTDWTKAPAPLEYQGKRGVAEGYIYLTHVSLIGTPSTMHRGATAYVRDLKGMFRSAKCNSHIQMALSTTKAVVGGNTSNTGPARLYQPTIGWNVLNTIRPPYHYLQAA